jgi:ubiquitin C-terminal hydrolase
MWQFADLCFRSSFLEKQIIGAKLIARLACHFNKECQVWAVKTQFISYVINEKVHENVMALLAAIPQYICDGGLPLKTLIQLYRRVNQLHSSQADVLSKFLSNALKSTNESLFSAFLKEVSQPLAPDLFNFLVIFARDALYSNPDMVRQIVSLLLDLTDKENAMADEAIMKLCDSALSNDTRNVILEHVLKHIHLIPTLGPRTKMFTKLVKTAAVISDKVQGQLMTAFLEAAKEHPQHDFDFVPFVKIIIENSQSVMPIQGVSYLVSSDRGWAMFAKLLKVRRLDFLDRETARALFERFDSMAFANVTLAQCNVIQEVLLAKAAEQGYVEMGRGAVQRRVLNPWLGGMGYLIAIVTTAKNDKATEQVLMFILALYQNATLDQYLSFFQNIRAQIERIGLSEQEYSARLLRLVHAMVLQYESFRDISIFGLARHKARHRKYITFTVKVTTETVEVHCSPSITGAQLTQLVASRLKIIPSYLHFKNRDVWVKVHDPVSKAGVRNGSVLHLADKYCSKPDPARPSTCVTALLSNLSIPDHVYEVIQSPDCSTVLKKCAWRFLMWMPTVKPVLDLSDEDFVTLLPKTKTTLHLQYLLQAAQVRAVRDLPSIVLRLLLSHRDWSYSGLCDALRIVSKCLAFERQEKVGIYGKLLLDHLLGPFKYRDSIIESLEDFVKAFPIFSATVFLQDKNRFDAIICGLEPFNLRKLVPLFGLFGEKKHKVFAALISDIDLIRNDQARLVPYFQLVSAVFDDSCDISASIKFCEALLDKPGSPLFPSICSLLLTIFSRHPDSCLEFLPLFDSLLTFLFQTTKQDPIISLLEIFCTRDETCNTKLQKRLFEYFSITTDRWGYDPSAHVRGTFAGLRNLGATCYMNSVFQQLFHNPAFRAFILELNPTGRWQIEFRAIFLRLLFTVLPAVDTQPFVANWQFYGEPVNPKEQQDAVEFFQLLMDRLGDQLYKGELAHRMVGEDFNQTRSEDFWAIPMEVKGCRVFEDSIRSFLQKETHNGYRAEPLGKNIDVQAFIRVSKLPDFLVVQLKRFEYDLNARSRTKVNEKFEFPKELNARQFMEEDGPPETYHLTGVILHTGTALGGHYASYIPIEDKWYSFDDTQVQEISESIMTRDSYGGHQSSNSEFGQRYPSAYLLFYAKSNVKVRGAAERQERDRRLLSQIDEENRAYLQMQSTFAPSMMALLLKTEDPELLFLYFFNIFVHSSDTVAARLFTSHFLEVVSKVEGLADRVVSKIREIEAVLGQCTCDEVCQAFLQVVEALIKKAAIDKSSKLVATLLDDLPLVTQQWRVIPHFMQLIMSFFSANASWVAEQQWIPRVLSFIHTALQTKSLVFLQNVNFSPAFLFFSAHVDLLSREQLSALCSLGSVILQSRAHAESYTQLVRSCAESGFVRVSEFLDVILASVKTSTESTLIPLFMQFATNEHLALQFVKSQRIPKDCLVRGFRIGMGADLRARLASLPSVLFWLMTYRSTSVCGDMESLFLEIFNDVGPMVHYTRASTCLRDRVTVSSFDWKDSPHARLPGERDRSVMLRVLSVFIDGCKQIRQDPDQFLSGPGATIRLNEFLRVTFWMMIRTAFEPSQAQTESLLDLFDAFHSVKLVDNTNLLELVRLARGLPRSAFPVIAERFHRIAEIVFTAPVKVAALKSWLFSCFFETFEAFLIANPDVFPVLITSDSFQQRFNEVCVLQQKALISRLVKLAGNLDYDLSQLAGKNFRLLIKPDRNTLHSQMQQSTDSPIDDETFNNVLASIFRKLAGTVDEATGQYLLLERIKSLSKEHNIEITDELLIDLRKIVGQLARGSPEPCAANYTINLVTSLAQRSGPFRQAVLGVIAQSDGGGLVLGLKCWLLDHSSPEFAAAIVEIAGVLQGPYQKPVTEILLQLMTDVVQVDGIEAFKDSVAKVFQKFVAFPQQGDVLIQEVVRRANADWLIGLVREVFEGRDDERASWLLKRINDWIGWRKELKDPLIKAVGVSHETLRALRPTYGKAWRHLMADVT